jgi:sarcosine oxidase subunit alpha
MREEITVLVDGKAVSVPSGSMASAAIAASGKTTYRTSVRGTPRGPLCGMGICFECRVTIDGRPHTRSCQTLCQPGMEINTDAP